MVDLVTRELGLTAKGAPLTNSEVDTNFINLNEGVVNAAENQYRTVKNTTGSEIGKGVPVMTVGTEGASGHILIAPMDGTNPLNARFYLGLTAEVFQDGDLKRIVVDGVLSGADTSIYTAGYPLYISGTTVGELVETPPASIIMSVAFALNSKSNGTLAVRSTAINEVVDGGTY
jgi:hypothetical protein